MPSTPSPSRNKKSLHRESNRKWYHVKTVIDNVKLEIAEFDSEEQPEILAQIIEKLSLLDENQAASKKPSRAGRASIAKCVKQKVWKFWHTESQPSTLTTNNISKLLVTEKPKIHKDLEYVKHSSTT